MHFHCNVKPETQSLKWLEIKEKDQGKKISVDEGDEMYKVKGALKKVGAEDPGQRKGEKDSNTY